MSPSRLDSLIGLYLPVTHAVKAGLVQHTQKSPQNIFYMDTSFKGCFRIMDTSLGSRAISGYKLTSFFFFSNYKVGIFG